MRSAPLAMIACGAVFSAGLASACASSNNNATTTPNSTNSSLNTAIANAAVRSPNVISQVELDGTGVSNALQAVQRLRPNFLVVRGNISKRGNDVGVVVYSNNSRVGGTSALGDIPLSEVRRIEFLDASEATQRFGTGNTHGAILVTRK
jgi:hypothetical protein